MKGKYTILKDKPKEFFRLIPQTGVTHVLCEEEPGHNAIWDMAVSPEGRIFFSICGESYEALYARLYEFDRAEKRFVRHFGLEEEIIMDPKTIRTSKFHTAISFIGDGTILTATHTTSPAPTHPTWMPYEYIDHPYEGYPGSNLLLYNYENGDVKNLGVMSPHDTVYGATYDPKNGDYFGITWMRGMGYVYNVHTKTLRELGQVSDTHTSRTFLLSDGHIYGTTYSGAMFRYNTDLREVEFLGVNTNGLMRHARERDGILYFTTGPCSVPGRGQELYAYELATRKLWTIGRPAPKAESYGDEKSAFYNAYGMDFDSQGRLWYGVMTFVPHHKYVGARLFMWDFLNGKEPVDCGFLGSEKRTLSISAEMHIIDDVIYVSDGNHTSHCDTPSGIIAIELDKFVPALESEERLMSHDYINYLPYQEECREWYPKKDFDECFKLYEDYYENTVEYFEKFVNENNAHAKFAGASSVSVWERVGFGNTAVREIKWRSNSELTLTVGNESYNEVAVSLNEGRATVVSITPTSAPDHSEIKCALPALALPAVPGRRYIANAEAAVEMKDGSILVGTGDTMLARISGEKVFSLGRVATAGGVHSLDVAPDGTVWGIAGHDAGCGVLFKYDDECGVTLLGILPEVFAENGRNVAIYRPTTLAVSPDGSYLAVGGADEIGGAVILKIN